MDTGRLLKLITPTVTQVTVCIALALAIHFLVFQSVIFSHLFKPGNLTPYLNTGKQIELSNLNSFAIVRLTVQGAFWAIVGLCAYVIYLGLINAFVEARNEVVVTTEFTNKGKNTTWINTFKWQFMLLGVLILALWITAAFGFDWWFSMMAKLVIGGVSASHIVGALVSVLGLAANVYVLWVLAEGAVVADR